MSNKRRLMYCALAGVLLLSCLAIYNNCQKPVVVDVKRDTVVVFDTIPDIMPRPKDSVVTRYVTRYLPVVKPVGITDTLTMWTHDTVAVEVPITSKHYGGDNYDAWVSGYEPSLDSITIYQRTEYITQTVAMSKPPNKWELDGMAVVNYNIKTQKYPPYIGGELTYKPSRLQVGVQAGIAKLDNVQPYVGGVVRYRVF